MMSLLSTFQLEVCVCIFYTLFHISYKNTDTNVPERSQTFGDLAAIAAAAGMVDHFTAAYHI